MIRDLHKFFNKTLTSSKFPELLPPLPEELFEALDPSKSSLELIASQEYIKKDFMIR